MLPGLAPCVVTAPLKLTYIGDAANSNDLATYNFGNFVIPTAGLMIVNALAGAATDNVISTITIAGVVANMNIQAPSSRRMAGIASREVSAGAHNVTVSLNGGAARASCGVWLLTGYRSTIPFDTSQADSGSLTTSISATLGIPAGGAAVFGNFRGGTAGTNWSSAVKRADFTNEVFFSFADKSTPEAIAPHTETASWPTSGNSLIIAAAWR